MKRLYGGLVAILCMVGQSTTIEIPYEEHNYRRADCGDVLFLLEVTNAIERSTASNYVVVYPYVLREQFLHAAIKRKALFIATNQFDQADAVLRLVILEPEEVEKLMDETSIKDWREKYRLNDVFLYSDYWYTEPVLRNQGIWTKLFAYALQMSADRIAAYMRGHGSTHIYMLVRMVKDASNYDVVQHLLDTVKDWFSYVVTTLPQHYDINMTKPIFDMTTTETIKPVYDLEAADLKVINKIPATLYMFVARVQ